MKKKAAQAEKLMFRAKSTPVTRDGRAAQALPNMRMGRRRFSSRDAAATKV